MAVSAIAYRLSNHGPRHDRSQYANLTIEIMLGQSVDAAREYDEHPTEYELQRLQAIRSQGRSSKYFVTSGSDNIALQWLGSRESFEKYETEWFALRAEPCPFDASYVKLLARIIKQCGESTEPSPYLILSILHSMKARRVHYGNGVYGAWIYDDEPTVDDVAIPWKKPEPVESV